MRGASVKGALSHSSLEYFWQYSVVQMELERTDVKTPHKITFKVCKLQIFSSQMFVCVFSPMPLPPLPTVSYRKGQH